MFRKAQLFLIKRCFTLLEKYERQYGFHETIKKLLRLAHAKIIIKGLDSNLDYKLKNTPTIVVANHPTSASVLALIAALPTRSDIYLFVGAKFYGHSANIDAHLIPAYINNRCQPKNRPYPDTLPREEEHRRNIESVKHAAEIVNRGGMVLIFPGYPEEPNRGWYNGVGYLIKQVVHKDCSIALVHIKENPLFGYLRIIPYLGLFLSHIYFYFTPPITLQEVNTDNQKQITCNLERRFLNQICFMVASHTIIK